jgi:hypothetical protein
LDVPEQNWSLQSPAFPSLSLTTSLVPCCADPSARRLSHADEAYADSVGRANHITHFSWIKKGLFSEGKPHHFSATQQK